MDNKNNAFKDNEENLIALNEHLSQKITSLKNEVVKHLEANSNLQKERNLLLAKCSSLETDLLKANSQLELAKETIQNKHEEIAKYRTISNDYDKLLIKDQNSIRNLNLTREKLKARENILAVKERTIKNLQKTLFEKEVGFAQLAIENKQLRKENDYPFFSFQGLKSMSNGLNSLVIILILGLTIKIINFLREIMKFFRKNNKGNETNV